ncbi:MAG: M48 family metallopeptidase [Planctomycetota bacterium]
MVHAFRPFFALALFLLPGACANLNFYSDDELNKLGVEAYAESTKEHPEIKSGAQYEMVQRVGRKIAAASEENFEWEFKLLKADDTPNAFCLPGGKVAIYTGILPLTENENGLAAVMGHEVAHAILRHGGKRMSQNMVAGGLLSAVQAGMGMAAMGEQTQQMTMAVLGGAAKVGVLLPFSRDHETEADVEGLRYAIRAGYDPEEAPRLWERMAKLGGSDTPSWLSTHPASEERAANLRKLIPQLREQEKGWKPKPPPATPGAPTKKVDPGAVGR